jgi:hypothetical protein
VFAQIRLQLTDRHSVDARTALVAPHTLERFQRVLARDDLLHQQAVASRALSSPRRPSGFAAALARRGFTPSLQR